MRDPKANIHGLEPTPEKAFQIMEGLEREAYRTRRRLEAELVRAQERKVLAELDIERIEKDIRAVNGSVPAFGRSIE